jgi:ArsR family transcriptional regulator
MFKGSVATDSMDDVVRALKGAAEPTRLRLLFLLCSAEYTVSELCTILGQSQPRISRHLRLLTEAGFLDRFREQQCVYYRAPVSGRQLEWLRNILAMLDPDAALLRLDRERAVHVIRERASAAQRKLGEVLPAAGTPPAAGAPDEREELSTVLNETLGPATVGELLDIGTGCGLMLEILAPRARHAVGVDISAPALRVARTRLHSAGLAHCEFRRGDMYRLPFDDARFDTVTIDRLLAAAERPSSALAEAVRTLRPGGRLIVVEDFDQMDARSSENPLSLLRQWLTGAGLSADRLRPCDLGGRHYVLALAARPN